MGQWVNLPWICISHNIIKNELTMWQKQFPVALAYALTIDKAQGQSLEWVGLTLQSNVFVHRQLYMGISHAKDPDNIIICLPPKKKD